MSVRRVERWLVASCVCALAALALMMWQLFDPTVWPVMVAMSFGQVLGTASFAAFGYVVLADFRATISGQKLVEIPRSPRAQAGKREPP
jgi:uncharacterized membrane protein